MVIKYNVHVLLQGSQRAKKAKVQSINGARMLPLSARQSS